eukprot:CAMPEP_0182902242 /NCGR_PEP_ID=MMETSP0034_2-20130328/30315_1 /TAXON_ID=156128 /ORGANISM="Nephroselmis pyriformis, Strain CCMP717" /LENGTH=38 /DNA_ID= /DNA_START= /DNA_END= /DNA_ORIENTATION=
MQWNTNTHVLYKRVNRKAAALKELKALMKDFKDFTAAA